MMRNNAVFWPSSGATGFSYLSELLSNVYYEKKLKRTKEGVKEEVLTSIY